MSVYKIPAAAAKAAYHHHHRLLVLLLLLPTGFYLQLQCFCSLLVVFVVAIITDVFCSKPPFPRGNSHQCVCNTKLLTCIRSKGTKLAACLKQVPVNATPYCSKKVQSLPAMAVCVCARAVTGRRCPHSGVG